MDGIDHDTFYTLTNCPDGDSLRLPDVPVTVTMPDRQTISATIGLQPLVIGASKECDIVLRDPRASRKHCTLKLTERGVVLRDLGSKNGTLVRGIPIMEALLPQGMAVTVGGSELVLGRPGRGSVLPLSSLNAFGAAVGRSLPMRALFAKLERVAPTEEIALLLGESGTGKEVLARALHERSRRKDGPFVVVDCGAIAPNMVESELFGHTRGAYTGAVNARTGLFEQANGGTLFIDEVGELPLDLQPKLLRALESRQFRPIGSSEWVPFDARVIAATHRNLRKQVDDGTFRGDLYYRLAVVEVYVPALRERKEDIPLLVERFLATRDPPCKVSDLPAGALSMLDAYDWPGNVRELRNTVARLVLFPELLDDLAGRGKTQEAATANPSSSLDLEGVRLGKLLELSLADAREAVIEELDRAYVSAKLRQHGGNISRAAEAMGASRQLVHRLVDRHGLRLK